MDDKWEWKYTVLDDTPWELLLYFICIAQEILVVLLAKYVLIKIYKFIEFIPHIPELGMKILPKISPKNTRMAMCLTWLYPFNL